MKIAMGEYYTRLVILYKWFSISKLKTHRPLKLIFIIGMCYLLDSKWFFFFFYKKIA